MNDSPMIRVWFDDHREPVLFRNYEAAMNSMKNDARAQENLREHWKAFACLIQQDRARYLEEMALHSEEEAKQDMALLRDGVVHDVQTHIHDLARAAYGSASKNFEGVHVEFINWNFRTCWRRRYCDYEEGRTFDNIPDLLEWLQKWAEQGKIEQITLERRPEINT
jgi:hypothetical protein